MKRFFYYRAAALLIAGMYIFMSQPVRAQSGVVEFMDSTSMEAQLDYIQQRTRVYNDYRAIREDVFQKLKRNVNDTLREARLEIADLKSQLTEKDSRIETLNTDLARTKTEKDEAIRNRDSLSFLGIQMNKTLYSSIVWLIILGLVVLALIMFFLFKRSHQVTREVKDHLKILQEEFEQYRKSSREKYEKLVVSHHNEIMKLKNS
jgi:preprotein translocase subunit SecF